MVEGSRGLPTDFGSPDYTRAQWREGKQLRTEQVVSPATVKVGDPIELWLNDSGMVVAAPLTVEDAKVSAAGAAVILWVTIVACSAFAALVVRRTLDDPATAPGSANCTYSPTTTTAGPTGTSEPICVEHETAPGESPGRSSSSGVLFPNPFPDKPSSRSVRSRRLLACHGNPGPFVGIDVVVGGFGVLGQVDLHPVDAAVVCAGVCGVIGADGGTCLATDIGDFVGRENISLLRGPFYLVAGTHSGDSVMFQDMRIGCLKTSE